LIPFHDFNSFTDAQGSYFAVITDSGKELARARVDFAKLR
jgi:hypothetical protein